MKLEIKHLAPYLPYGLKVLGPVSDSDFRDLKPENIAVIIDDIFGPQMKPILRPLSDLNKHNDKVEINEHYINEVLTNPEYGQEYGVFSHYKGEIDIELDGDPQVRYDQTKIISFKCIQKITELLYKGHYDVFNLIPNGLAIDINTLNL
jgi:hypothetical protein